MQLPYADMYSVGEYSHSFWSTVGANCKFIIISYYQQDVHLIDIQCHNGNIPIAHVGGYHNFQFPSMISVEHGGQPVCSVHFKNNSESINSSVPIVWNAHTVHGLRTCIVCADSLKTKLLWVFLKSFLIPPGKHRRTFDIFNSIGIENGNTALQMGITSVSLYRWYLIINSPYMRTNSAIMLLSSYVDQYQKNPSKQLPLCCSYSKRTLYFPVSI